MKRWLFFSIFILGAAVAAGVLIPEVGRSIREFFHRSEIDVIKVEEQDVQFDDEKKIRSMLAVTLEFAVPNAEAERHGDDFVLLDPKGNPVEFVWSPVPKREEKAEEERNLTRITGVIILPRKFRKGTFKRGEVKLGDILIPSVPYERK